MFKLGVYDLVKGFAVAVFGAILVGLYGAFSTSGFDLFSADWIVISHNMINMGAFAGVTYLFTNLLSTKSGSVLNLTIDHPQE